MAVRERRSEIGAGRDDRSVLSPGGPKDDGLVGRCEPEVADMDCVVTSRTEELGELW